MYSIGDKVVCAGHGAGEIVGIGQRESDGLRREYLTIAIAHNDLTVMMPADKARTRLRAVMSAEDVERVFATLRSGRPRMPESWIARSRRMQDMLGTGDALELAQVVRALALRDAAKALPVGEKQLMVKAQKHLASELKYARGVSEAEARGLLEEALGRRIAEPVPA